MHAILGRKRKALLMAAFSASHLHRAQEGGIKMHKKACKAYKSHAKIRGEMEKIFFCFLPGGRRMSAGSGTGTACYHTHGHRRHPAPSLSPNTMKIHLIMLSKHAIEIDDM